MKLLVLFICCCFLNFSSPFCFLLSWFFFLSQFCLHVKVGSVFFPVALSLFFSFSSSLSLFSIFFSLCLLLSLSSSLSVRSPLFFLFLFPWWFSFSLWFRPGGPVSTLRPGLRQSGTRVDPAALGFVSALLSLLRHAGKQAEHGAPPAASKRLKAPPLSPDFEAFVGP